MQIMSNNQQPVLTIDFGNTNPNIMIHESHGIEKFFKLDSLEEIDKFAKNKNVIVSSVRRDLSERLTKFENLKNALEISQLRKQNSFCEMNVNYSDSLGEDRLVTAFYVWKNHLFAEQENIIIVDSGTFTTVDIINKKGFEGGHILPGDQTYLRVFDIFGKNLPDLEFNKIEQEQYFQTPSNTEDAILMGQRDMFLTYYLSLASRLTPSKIFVTGGNYLNHYQMLASASPLSEFITDDKLIHKALKYLYDHLPQ